MKMHEGIEGICVFASPCCLQGQYGLDATFVHSLSPKDTAFRAGEKLFGFTMQVVLTLASEGSGRCEWGATHFCWPRLYVSHSVSSRWRKIAEDGQELQEARGDVWPKSLPCGAGGCIIDDAGARQPCHSWPHLQQ